MIDINEELCKGCDICIDFCPLEVLATSGSINRRGYYPPEVVGEEKCIGCRLCELVCPEFAITICNE
jgi:2-oxoglutarate ferredoxin oxidoreductase subunit delta